MFFTMDLSNFTRFRWACLQTTARIDPVKVTHAALTIAGTRVEKSPKYYLANRNPKVEDLMNFSIFIFLLVISPNPVRRGKRHPINPPINWRLSAQSCKGIPAMMIGSTRCFCCYDLRQRVTVAEGLTYEHLMAICFIEKGSKRY